MDRLLLHGREVSASYAHKHTHTHTNTYACSYGRRGTEKTYINVGILSTNTYDI